MPNAQTPVLVKMSNDAKAVEKQAVTCIRMGMDMAAVERVAKARKWYGRNRNLLLNRVRALRFVQNLQSKGMPF